MSKQKTCCFTGHRRLPRDQIGGIAQRLDVAIDVLIAQGITHFISGGALGFDQIAAWRVLVKRDERKDIRLTLALPCAGQEERWSMQQKGLYRKLLAKADRIVYVSDQYDEDCMKRRNQFMVNHSAVCLCAWIYPHSGTAQTVKYAMERGVRIINVVK